MVRLTVQLPIEDIERALTQLKPEELRRVLSHMQGRLETFQMMKLAESAFSEWLTEEDLYRNG